MPFRLEKQRTGVTPYVLIDEETGYIKLEGESFSENIISFFGEISQWLKGYLRNDFQRLTFDCDLQYFNSSTAKLLLNMILDIDEAALGKTVVVNWITLADDDINIECGEDFKEMVEHLDFQIVLKS